MPQNSINTRLLLLIKNKQMNVNSFSLACGLKPQIVHNIVSAKGRQTNPSFEVLQKILSTFDDINPDWLIHGTEPFNKNVSIASEPHEVYQSQPRPINSMGLPNCYYVPIKAYGGFLNGYENSVFLEGLQKFNVPFITGECFCFEIDGFSMADEYLPGDKVYCTKLTGVNELLKGKDYIFQTIDGILLKKFDKITDEKLQMISVNPDPKYLMEPVPLKNIKVVYFIEEHLRKPNKK